MISSVYIHIPFCRSICTYCDFCKFLYNKEWSNSYLKKLENEIESRYMDEEIKTIYIGGGTPSILRNEELDILFNIIKKFKKSNELEFTFECNLEDITSLLIDKLVGNGVNRISIGIESFNDDNLKLMNRTCNFEDALNKVKLIRSKGIDNINFDLIYALPDESLKTVKKDLKLLLKLNPDHISTYSLIIEDNTFLSYKKVEKLDEELDYKMYNYIVKKLNKKGYEHYEISNFAKPGYESKHNLVYWKNEEYYGFGCGASGYVSGVRYSNTRSLTKYIEADIFSSKELLSKDDIMDYHLMLGFRLIKGINLEEFERIYGISMESRYPIKALLKYGDLIIKNGNIMINPDRIYVMNEILSKCV